MGADVFESTINFIKLVIVFLMMIQMVPVLVWLERRGSGFIQHRFGPNRVGPLGLMQLLADAVKFMFKEEFSPEKSVRAIYYAAPVMALVPAALALAGIPFSTPIFVESFEWLGQKWGPYRFQMQTFDISIGIIYILGVSSLGVYSLLLAGWGSFNKYSLMGALRASAQMISYELAMGLTIVGTVLIFGTFNLNEIILAQNGLMDFTFFGKKIIFLNFLPNWGIFYQPLGAILFIVAAFAESNRLPFDLSEAEGELVAGYHTEYGGFKMLLFFIGEYGHMMVSSSLFAIFFLGGYSIPYIDVETVSSWSQSLMGPGTGANILVSIIHFLCFSIKVFLFLWLYIWVRWTLPRFKYNRLMELGWLTLLPWALVNIILTATVLFVVRYN